MTKVIFSSSPLSLLKTFLCCFSHMIFLGNVVVPEVSAHLDDLYNYLVQLDEKVTSAIVSIDEINTTCKVCPKINILCAEILLVFIFVVVIGNKIGLFFYFFCPFRKEHQF